MLRQAGSPSPCPFLCHLYSHQVRLGPSRQALLESGPASQGPESGNVPLQAPRPPLLPPRRQPIQSQPPPLSLVSCPLRSCCVAPSPCACRLGAAHSPPCTPCPAAPAVQAHLPVPWEQPAQSPLCLGLPLKLPCGQQCLRQLLRLCPCPWRPRRRSPRLCQVLRPNLSRPGP